MTFLVRDEMRLEWVKAIQVAVIRQVATAH